jgi:hypothetical protein
MTAGLTLLAVTAALLALPGSAAAGGWATVGLDPPTGLEAGDTWEAELTILQHGRTPLEGVEPRVVVSKYGKRSGDERIFPAKPTKEPGVYRAEVVFDEPGTWSYRVNDGFTAEHDFSPVVVREPGAAKTLELASTAAAAPPSAGDDGGPDYLLAILAAAAAAFMAGGGAALLQRRRAGAGPAAG